MSLFSRDICLTLIIKSILLGSLWWVCFHDAPKSTYTKQQWLLGVNDSAVFNEVTNDSR